MLFIIEEIHLFGGNIFHTVDYIYFSLIFIYCDDGDEIKAA